MDPEWECVICGCTPVEIHTFDHRKPEQKLTICKEHQDAFINDDLPYNERIILNEYIEANFGDVV
jgi:hypothetical protein